MGLINPAYAVNIEEVWPLATNFQSLGELVTSFLPIFLLAAGVIFFILTAFAGFSMITSAGSDDAQAHERWRMILTYGVTGLIIIFSAFWVIQIINFVTGGSLKGITPP